MFMDADPMQYMKFQGLLKSFDRGFWFQSGCEYSKKCPFGTPTTVGYLEVADDFAE